MRHRRRANDLVAATYIRVATTPNADRSVQGQAERVRAHAQSLSWELGAVSTQPGPGLVVRGAGSPPQPAKEPSCHDADA